MNIRRYVGRWVHLSVHQFKPSVALLSGIGRAVAMALHKLGANTVALSRTQEDLDTLKQQVRLVL